MASIDCGNKKLLFGSVVTFDIETPFFNSMMIHSLYLVEKEEKWA